LLNAKKLGLNMYLILPLEEAITNVHGHTLVIASSTSTI
jgi:hypothetical protein